MATTRREREGLVEALARGLPESGAEEVEKEAICRGPTPRRHRGERM